MSDVNKKLTNLEVSNIYNYFNRNEDNTFPMLELLNQFSVKAKWAFRINLKKIEEIVKLYNDVLKDLQLEYSDDEHSIESTETDDKGKETTIRTVKDKYIKEYQDKMQELLNQENDISVRTININDIADVKLEFVDLERLSFMIDEWFT